MTDLDNLLVDVLREDAAGAPPPHDRTTTVRRIRRRQVRTVATTIGVVVALSGFALAGASWLLGQGPRSPRSDRS
jgi:hypothetical protein